MRGGAGLRGGTEDMYKTRVCGTHYFHGLSALYQRYVGQVAAPPDCMVLAGRGTTRLVVNHSVANRPIGTVVQLQPKRVTGSALMVAWAV